MLLADGGEPGAALLAVRGTGIQLRVDRNRLDRRGRAPTT